MLLLLFFLVCLNIILNCVPEKIKSERNSVCMCKDLNCVNGRVALLASFKLALNVAYILNELAIYLFLLIENAHLQKKMIGSEYFSLMDLRLADLNHKKFGTRILDCY